MLEYISLLVTMTMIGLGRQISASSIGGDLFTIEMKSLQTSSVRVFNGRMEGRCQVDASDKRVVTLPDGSEVETTCLLAGKFDILAINLF